MFELLASAQTSDFIELATMVEYTKHLYSYGLIAKIEYGMLYIKMLVAGRYVALELAKREQRSSLYKIIDKEKRQGCVQQRIRNIIRFLRQLESAIHSARKNCLERILSRKQKNLQLYYQLITKNSLKDFLILATSALWSLLTIMEGQLETISTFGTV